MTQGTKLLSPVADTKTKLSTVALCIKAVLQIRTKGSNTHNDSP